MTIPLNFFIDYLKQKNLKPKTIQNYSYYFMKFGDQPLTRDNVFRFMSLSANQNLNARGFIRHMKDFIKNNYTMLGISEELKNEALNVDLPKMTGRLKQRLINPISPEEIKLLEEQLTTEKEKLQLVTAYNSGLRLGELMSIDILSFNWEEWKKDITKLGECRVRGKGDKEGIALIPSEVMIRIAKFIKTKSFNSLTDKIFLEQEQTIKAGCRQFEIKLREAGIKSGVTKLDENKKVITGTSVYPHRLRHSYATHMLNKKGINVFEVKELMRHSDIRSTQIYTHINKEELKKKLTP